MENWFRITLLLCAFGLLREIRPSEPYVTEFILGPWRNITAEQLNQEVYPVGTYSYLSQLVVVFLVTDFLRFKPVIIVSGICGITVYAILLWTVSLEWLQATQFFYGLYLATEVAYYTYIFAKVDSSHYPRVSSLTRTAALSGRFLSGLTAQFMTSFHLMDYRQLMYITFTAQILATFWAVFLPPVKYSVYFHQGDALPKSVDAGFEGEGTGKDSKKVSMVEACKLVACHATSAYTRPQVVLWSLLYAAASCLYVQTQSYVQLLWMDIAPDMETAYNGGVEATLTLGGVGGAMLASKYRADVTPGPIAAIQSAAVLAAALPGNIYLSYVGYVLTGVLFHYLITQASTKIAKELSDESCFGLIFGINTLLGTALQSLLTFTIISDNGLALPIRKQFYVISGCYFVLSILWMLGWAAFSLRQRRAMEKQQDVDNYISTSPSSSD